MVDVPFRSATQLAAARALRAAVLPHRDWLAANEARHRMRRAWAESFTRYDLLLCPAANIAAFPHQQASRPAGPRRRACRSACRSSARSTAISRVSDSRGCSSATSRASCHPRLRVRHGGQPERHGDGEGATDAAALGGFPKLAELRVVERAVQDELGVDAGDASLRFRRGQARLQPAHRPLLAFGEPPNVRQRSGADRAQQHLDRRGPFVVAARFRRRIHHHAMRPDDRLAPHPLHRLHRDRSRHPVLPGVPILPPRHVVRRP
ncbi:MAG: hypothetical protein HYR51_09790 [Candidatus Rokubacteria bacterium]|nr:hypothetical protein [Candidatus Rokubacteria bacterium]